MVRELAHYCSSTALAFSMHTHLVATLAYLWQAGNEGRNRCFAASPRTQHGLHGRLGLVDGLRRMEKVDGGFRLTGRKIFESGVPAGDVLMTTGVYDDPKDGPTVIHFPLPLQSEGVTILDTWKVLGMRGAGSHDVQLDRVFVPDAATGGVRRPAGKWHPR